MYIYNFWKYVMTSYSAFALVPHYFDRAVLSKYIRYSI